MGKTSELASILGDRHQHFQNDHRDTEQKTEMRSETGKADVTAKPTGKTTSAASGNGSRSNHGATPSGRGSMDALDSTVCNSDSNRKGSRMEWEHHHLLNNRGKGRTALVGQVPDSQPRTHQITPLRVSCYPTQISHRSAEDYRDGNEATTSNAKNC